VRVLIALGDQRVGPARDLPGSARDARDPLAPHLHAWPAWASRSRLRPFVRLARTLREHRDGILAAIRLGLSDGKASNSKIRLIRSPRLRIPLSDPLIALVYVCCAGIAIALTRYFTPQLERRAVKIRGAIDGQPFDGALMRGATARTGCP
jgi:hypothetical protein